MLFTWTYVDPRGFLNYDTSNGWILCCTVDGLYSIKSALEQGHRIRCPHAQCLIAIWGGIALHGWRWLDFNRTQKFALLAEVLPEW